MSARSGLSALLLLAAVPASMLAQGFSYAPGSAQYRIVSSMKGAQEAMGQRQEIESSSNQLLTVTIARGNRDTLNVTTRIDSITVIGMGGMTPPGMDKLPGFTVVSQLAPNGVVYSAKGPSKDSIPNADQLTDEISNLLPKVRGNLAARSTWTDTTSRTVSQGGMDIERKVVATYTVSGDTTVNGQKAWKVDRKANTTLAGSGAQGGQPMTLEGTSTGNGVMLISTGGTFLGYMNEEAVNIKVLLAANGMEVGITQNATTKVEKVK